MKKTRKSLNSSDNSNIVGLIDRASFEIILNYLEIEDLIEFSQLCRLFREYSKTRLLHRVTLLPESVLKVNENSNRRLCNKSQNWTICEYIHIIKINKAFVNSLTISIYHDSLWARVSSEFQNIKALLLRGITVGEQIIFDILSNLSNLQKLTLEGVDLKFNGATVSNTLNLSLNLKYLELNSNSEHFYTNQIIKYLSMQPKLKTLKIANTAEVMNKLILPHMSCLEVLKIRLMPEQILCDSFSLPQFEHLRVLNLNIPEISSALLQTVLNLPNIEKLSIGGRFQGLPKYTQPLQSSSLKSLNILTSIPIEWYKILFTSCPNVISLKFQQPKDHRVFNLIPGLTHIRHLEITGYFSKILNIKGFLQMENLSKLEIHSLDSVCLLVEGCLLELRRHPDWTYSVQIDSILFRRARPLLKPTKFNSASNWFELPSICILQ